MPPRLGSLEMRRGRRACDFGRRGTLWRHSPKWAEAHFVFGGRESMMSSGAIQTWRRCRVNATAFSAGTSNGCNPTKAAPSAEPCTKPYRHGQRDLVL